MAIPIAQQTVMPEATQATAPEELHPLAAAFGGDIGAALQASGDKVADRIQTLSFHMARMNYYRGEAQKQDLINQYQSDLLDKTMGTGPNDPRTVTSVGGNVMPDSSQLSLSQAPPQSSTANISGTGAPAVEIPAAIYNRQGYEANGALEDFKAWHQATVQQYLQKAQGLGVRVDSQFKTSMDKLGASEEFQIAKHQTTQVEQAQIKTYMTGLQLSAEGAVTKQDPASLGLTVDAINQQVDGLIKTQHLDNDPSGPIMAELQKNKFVGQALNNSITATLKTSGGDPAQAQNMLDRLHADNRITDTQYNDANDNLDKTAKAITAQNEIGSKTQAVNEQSSIINSALQGKLDSSNPNTLGEITSKYPKLGEALTHYNNNKGSLTAAGDDKDDDFLDSTKKMLETGSKEQVIDYVSNVMKEKDISQDRMNILIGTAMDRGKSLPDLNGQSKSSNPTWDKIDGGVKSLMNWGKETGIGDAQTITDFLGNIKNKSVADAHNDAITNTIVRNHPAVASMSTPPNMVITGKNDIKYIFPRTNRKEEDGSSTTDNGK